MIERINIFLFLFSADFGFMFGNANGRKLKKLFKISAYHVDNIPKNKKKFIVIYHKMMEKLEYYAYD